MTTKKRKPEIGTRGLLRAAHARTVKLDTGKKPVKWHPHGSGVVHARP